MSKKVFIFGAGASTGSQETGTNHYVISPITDNLFISMYNSYWGMFGITEKEAKQVEDGIKKLGSLEKWLNNFWDELQNKTAASQQRDLNKLGKFTLYIWWLMQQVSQTYSHLNKYNLLLEKILDYQIDFSIINFNYDTLLDQAMIDNGLLRHPSTINDYFSANYIKPHGSVNWFVKSRTGIDPSNLQYEIRSDTGVMFKTASAHLYRLSKPIPGSYKVYPPNASLLRSPDHLFPSEHYYFYPLIFIPMIKKLYSHVDGFLEMIIEESKKMVAEADEIYLIGYRANDEIIQEIFQSVKTDTMLHVVGREGAGKIADKLVSMNFGLQKASVYKHGFEQFVNEF